MCKIGYGVGQKMAEKIGYVSFVDVHFYKSIKKFFIVLLFASTSQGSNLLPMYDRGGSMGFTGRVQRKIKISPPSKKKIKNRNFFLKCV